MEPTEAHSEKAKSDLAWCRSQIEQLPVYQRNRELCEDVLERILPKYIRCYGTKSPAWSKIQKRLAKELNETEPAITYIRNLVDRASCSDNNNNNNNNNNNSLFRIVDVCSGFGIASMLLSDLLDPSKVDKIFLLDVQWPYKADNPEKHNISTAHILDRKDWPIPLRIRKMNIKRTREKKQLEKYVYGDDNNKIIFLGIHLCKKLAVHGINMFTDCRTAEALVLKPCCLPGTRPPQLYIRDANHKKVPIVYEFSNGYSFRPLDLVGAGVAMDDDGNEDQEESSSSSLTQVSSSSAHRGATAMDVQNANNDNVSLNHHDTENKVTSHRRFSLWLDHLQRGCCDPNCRVRRETIEIQQNHFQNQFLFCERIANEDKQPMEEEGLAGT